MRIRKYQTHRPTGGSKLPCADCDLRRYLGLITEQIDPKEKSADFVRNAKSALFFGAR